MHAYAICPFSFPGPSAYFICFASQCGNLLTLYMSLVGVMGQPFVSVKVASKPTWRSGVQVEDIDSNLPTGPDFCHLSVFFFPKMTLRSIAAYPVISVILDEPRLRKWPLGATCQNVTRTWMPVVWVTDCLISSSKGESQVKLGRWFTCKALVGAGVTWRSMFATRIYRGELRFLNHDSGLNEVWLHLGIKHDINAQQLETPGENMRKLIL